MAVDHYLGLSASELSRRLGYANPSTLRAIRNGLALPDFARLAEHKGALKDDQGRIMNLHWVITGEGSPLLGQEDQEKSADALNLRNNDIVIKINKMNSKKQAALLKFLSEFD